MSRRKRKRYREALKRRGLEPEASARKPTLRGGWGQGAGMTRGDWRLVRQAANQDWLVPQAVRATICDQILPTLDAADEQPRLALAVTWAALAMDQANLRVLQAEIESGR